MSKEATEITFPPAWCSAICRNAMGEVCVTNCSLKRDCSAFEPKTDLNLEDMPPMPDQSQLTTPAEKFTCLYIYTQRMTDHLNGVTHEPRIFKRNLDSKTSRRVFADFKGESLQLNQPETNTVYQAPKKREDQEVGSD